MQAFVAFRGLLHVHHHVLPTMYIAVTSKLAAPHAGFHNATLYEALKPSISPLVALLRDEEVGQASAFVAQQPCVCMGMHASGQAHAIRDGMGWERCSWPGTRGSC